MNTFLLIDGNSLLHRAFHAIPPFKTSEGTPTNAIYGFMTILNKNIEDFKPNYIAVCFDTAAPTFRNKLFKNYQINRPAVAAELIPQFALIRQVIRAAGIAFFEKDGVEADDLIGTLSAKLKNKKFRVLILSGDRDFMQLVEERVFLITPRLGITNTIIYDRQEVIKKFNVKPENIIDYKALVGDASDNYSGVGGIGPTTASKLISKFGSVEEIYKKIDQIKEPKIREKLFADKDNAFLCKKLATILQDVKLNFNIEDCRFISYNDKLKDEFEKLQFNSLFKRIFNKEQVKKKVGPDDKKQMDLFK